MVDKTAPHKNARAVFQLSVSLPVTIPTTVITAKTTATKTTKILYSENKKAFAPSLIEAAISFILSVPASFLLILSAKIMA